jgi:hypothetical protein
MDSKSAVQVRDLKLSTVHQSQSSNDFNLQKKLNFDEYAK